MDKQSKLYHAVNDLIAEVVNIMRERHNLKVVGSFSDRFAPVTITISFASDQKAERLIYNVDEILKGVNPKSVVGILEERLSLL